MSSTLFLFPPLYPPPPLCISRVNVQIKLMMFHKYLHIDSTVSSKTYIFNHGNQINFYVSYCISVLTSQGIGECVLCQ